MNKYAMSGFRYFAVKPTNQNNQNIRIERARTPTEACALAFGRSSFGYHGFSWKDLGSRVAVLHSDKQRIALLLDPKGWFKFPDPHGLSMDEAKLKRIFEEIKADGDLIEDRREYDPEELARTYELTKRESQELFHLIQNEFKE